MPSTGIRAGHTLQPDTCSHRSSGQLCQFTVGAEFREAIAFCRVDTIALWSTSKHVAMDELTKRAGTPLEDLQPWVRLCWNKYTLKELQSVDKSKPEQGQGEEFIAILNPRTWSKGTSDGDCSRNTFKMLQPMI